MTRATVEAAISIVPAGTITYSWTNDYTLRINISQLSYETNYTLTIDGSVAKNSETGSFLDGDGDGTAGGNYVLNFKTGEQDTEAPTVVSYGPESASLQEEAARPIVRIEFSEPLNTATIAPNQITVTDATGETVGGTQKYTVVNGKSVLHYFFTADLQPQATYRVTLAGGVEDLYGNAIAAGLEYTFTARPRAVTVVTVLDNFNTIASSWWTPGASGSTLGLNNEVSQRIHSDEVSSLQTANTGSMRLDYLWLESATSHMIREHSTLTSPVFSKDNVVQMYLFGDGSYSKFRVAVRVGGGGTIWSNVPIEINWVGWKLISWDMTKDPFANWLVGSGTDPLPTASTLNLSALGLDGAPVDKIVFTPSYILFDELQLVKLGNFLTSVKEVKADAGITVSTPKNVIEIVAENVLNDINVYTITGELVKTVKPGATTCQIPTSGLSKGVYIVKVTTATSQKNVKVIVK
jgi:hypothetical protein